MYQLIVKNGFLLDGTGNPGYYGDVAIRDGRIAAVGKDLGSAEQILDATGLTVTPGFIDSHSHADAKVLEHPLQAEKTEQGVTTSIAGQCGNSAAPVAKMTFPQFMDQLKKTPLGANLVCFVGHGTLRKAVMPEQDRAPTDRELEAMKAILAEALEHGAGGLSFGLFYAPGCFAREAELVALAKVAAAHGAPVSAHIRNEGDQVVEAVGEFIRVIRMSGARGILSHHKAVRRRNWPKIQKTLALLQQAVAEGLDIYCDVYPYCASSTTFSQAFVPKSWRAEGVEGLLRNLADPDLCRENKRSYFETEEEDLSWVQVTVCPGYPQYEGLRLPEIAQLHGKDPFDTAMDLIRDTKDSCKACFFSIGEEQMLQVLAWERTMVGSDGGLQGTANVYHPRLRGSFSRALRYVRERGVVSLPEMIRKMTMLPAQVYGLTGKGLLRPGYDGDICVFDPETVCDRAGFINCHEKAEGLRWVLVNGQVASENAIATGAFGVKPE